MLFCKGSLYWINSFKGEVEGMTMSLVRISGFSASANLTLLDLRDRGFLLMKVHTEL